VNALQLYSTSVRAEWVDYNDHLSEWAYLLIFGDNADAFFRYIGIDDDYRAAGHSLYTAETHLRHLREVKLGESLALTLQVLGLDRKRLHLLHEMHAVARGAPGGRPPGLAPRGCVATGEQMLLHVDTGTGRVAPFGAGLAERLRALAVSHSVLSVPDYVGRPIRPLAGA
jgi:acyl-CoA thioester hydrolase